MKQTTWFTKGLRHFFVALNTDFWYLRNKRPDLRRDCDDKISFILSWLASRKQTTWFTKGLRPMSASASIMPFNISAETNDLIYEGIATPRTIVYFTGYTTWNKRPDLRRDCDIDFIRFIPIISHDETNDLIYEGIATQWQRVPAFGANTGLRRNKRPDLRRDCDDVVNLINV